MKNNKSGNEKITLKRHSAENCDTWTEDGKFILDDCAKDSLMDRVNRRCNGEELSPLDEEKNEQK